jgi:hypothetical protein
MRVLGSALVDRMLMLVLRRKICVNCMYMTNCVCATHCILVHVLERIGVIGAVVGAVSLLRVADCFLVIIYAQDR